MTDQPTIPQGVLVIVHWPDGDVLASISDFDRSGYGGFTLFEAQRMRAKDAAKREAIRKLCHDDVAFSIDSYRASEIIADLINKKGYSLTVVPIGYPADVEKEREKGRRS